LVVGFAGEREHSPNPDALPSAHLDAANDTVRSRRCRNLRMIEHCGEVGRGRVTADADGVDGRAQGA